MGLGDKQPLPETGL